MAEGSELLAGKYINLEALHSPLPDLSAAREAKAGYRGHPIDDSSPYFKEELVNIRDYGLAGQAYYSRPNAATGEAVDEISKELFLRRTLADKLATINSFLADPAVAKFFGGPVELYIEDAYRSLEIQTKLYENVFPRLIRDQNPGIDEVNFKAKLRDLIAKPIDDSKSPSPHMTGGVVDLALRYSQKTADFVAGVEVYMGRQDGDTSERTFPDYFETHQPKNGHDKFAQRNRRAFYAIMSGLAFDETTELQINPTEFWHWSWGDQMWAKLRDQPAALYGLVKKP